MSKVEMNLYTIAVESNWRVEKKRPTFGCPVYEVHHRSSGAYATCYSEQDALRVAKALALYDKIVNNVEHLRGTVIPPFPMKTEEPDSLTRSEMNSCVDKCSRESLFSDVPDTKTNTRPGSSRFRT